MATLNELGRNSASVTYGPYATGQDLFPTLQAVDTWFRNDTWQGTATASGTTLTGTGTIWTTQARSGDYIVVGNQLRIVNTVTSDTTMTVTVAFSPAISTASLIRVVSSTQSTQTSGYISYIARGDTNGTVSVTANSSTITGTGTYFLAEATNSVATVSMTGTIAIDTAGVITGTTTVFSTGAPTNNSLYPGDSIAVTSNGAIFYFEIASVSSDTSATVTVAPTTAIASGATVAKATNGVVGRSIQINGRFRTITAIASNTSMTVNVPMDFTDSGIRYKVYPRGTISNSSSAGGTLYGTSSATSTNSTTLTIAATLTGVLQPGCVIYGSTNVTIPAGTTIVNQQFGATGAATANTSATGTSGQNTLSLTSATGVAVGQLVCGNGATIAGIPNGTYVVSLSGTTATLSQNLTGAISTTVYFYTPGGLGAYTTSNATTTSAAQIYFSTLQATNANLFWDLGSSFSNSTTNTVYMQQNSALDQVWIGDEVRTLNFSTYGGTLMSNSATYAYTTDYAGYGATAIGAIRQGVYLIPFKREDSYINGNIYGTTTAFLSDLRIGDELIIDGTEVTVTNIVSNTQFKIDRDFTHTTANNSGGAATATTTYSSGGAAGASTIVMTGNTGVVVGQLITGVGVQQGTYVTAISTNTMTLSLPLLVQATGTYSYYNGVNFYKKLKLHGYTLEGTREGGVGVPTATTAGSASFTTVMTAGSASTTTLTVTTITGTNVIYPGMQVLPTTPNGANITGLTYVTNQLFATGPSVNYTSCTGTAGTNVITTGGVATGTILPGMIVTGNGAALAQIPASTYVVSVTGTSPAFTVTLNQNITTTFSALQVYFGNGATQTLSGGPGNYTTSASTTTQAALTFYTPLTGKFTEALSILATNGTSYPIGTTSLTLSRAPTVGQYNFIKISGAGGPPIPLTGQITSYVNTFVTGVNTLFTTQLHIGAEIIVAGQYLTVVSITSDTVLNVAQNAGSVVVPYLTPIYRSEPLYTYITAVAGAVVTLATPIKANLYTNAANPPMVYLPSTGADFLEYVYSAPNYSAEQGSTTLLNTSLDRKYVGFRMWPLYQSSNIAPTNTSTITTAYGAYATPVYERWAASYAQTHGVGINQADLSGGTMIWGSQTTTTLTQIMPVAGSMTLQMGIQGLATGYPNPMTAVTGTLGSANSTYTVTTGTIGTNTVAGAAAIVASIYGQYDITTMTQLSGGTLFLFGNKRYFAIQGRSSTNQQTQWVGCIEFERAQPEDVGTGTGTTTGVTFGGVVYGGAQLAQGAAPPTLVAPGFSASIQYTAGTAPYPTYGYFNGNRMPVGAQQIPTIPQLGTTGYPVHGCVLACPRVRNSAGDLVGFNAHIYSAMTITTGRWGHQVELGSYGIYTPAQIGSGGVTVAANTLTNIANAVPQIHLGQIVPVYTNIYNSKRFMFSPVVVLGPAYDPDVRGRLFGLKVLPAALGTLMDTVSITVDGNYFYNTSFTATDHWVVGSPPSDTITTAYPGQYCVRTTRFTLTQNTPQIQQSWRSLEDTSTQATNAQTAFINNFRFALPA